jgi:hypothetical protein
LRATAPTYLAGIAEHFGRHLSDEELGAIATALWRVHTAFVEESASTRGPGEVTAGHAEGVRQRSTPTAPGPSTIRRPDHLPNVA